jgi:hypothetical protein
MEFGRAQVGPRDIQKLLAYEAKRSPDLAHLIDNITAMSDDEIRQAKVKLPWMRTALLDLKKKASYKNLAEMILPMVVDGLSADPIGETRRWTGDNAFVRIGRSQLEIKLGELIWFDGKGLWIDTIYTTVIDPLMLHHTTSMGQMTRSAYMLAVRDRARSPQVATASTVDLVRDPMSSVRIFRPG